MGTGEVLSIHRDPALVPPVINVLILHDFSFFVGDVMGPSLSGLEKLLRLPTGCGEQNMIGFTPNIYVLQYLISTNQLTSEIESKAKEFMKTGQ